jgi:hypothetical protein
VNRLEQILAGIVLIVAAIWHGYWGYMMTDHWRMGVAIGGFFIGAMLLWKGIDP